MVLNYIFIYIAKGCVKMLKIYDLYGNQLGLVVGEFEKELLLWLGKHSVEEIGGDSIDFDLVETRCAKNLHILNKDQKFDKIKLREKLMFWWENKYQGLEFSYHLAVIYHNISKRDWTGIKLFENIESGIFTLLSYKNLTPNQKVPLDRGDFPQDLGDGKYLATIVETHPHVVTFEKTKLWDDTKKENGVFTQLSLRCGNKKLARKIPYFIFAKKGDKLLLEISNEAVPSVFVNGMKYSYSQNS